jgi:uncharacterized protein (DUF3820 family)
MDTQSLPIVPFGKYKGKPITDLLNDTKYLEWCKQQDWFQKFPIVYNICVNQTITTNQNSKTPEHNKLQNMFLEQDNVEKLWNIISKYIIFKGHKSLKLNTYKIEFEGKFNWDCIFKLYYDHQCLNGRNCCTLDCDGSELDVFIEIKPLLGDDYPCVLRKMKTQIELTTKTTNNPKKYILLINEYSSASTSKEQLIIIFKQSRITVVFINDLYDNQLSQIITEQIEQKQDTHPSQIITEHIEQKQDTQSSQIIIEQIDQKHDTQSNQETIKLKEENQLLQEMLLRAEEKIKQLDEEIILLKTKPQSKPITHYFGKK